MTEENGVTEGGPGDEQTADEDSPGIVETVLSAVGLGGGDAPAPGQEGSDEPFVPDDEPEEAAPLSQHDEARRNYKRSAGANAAAKQNRKENLNAPADEADDDEEDGALLKDGEGEDD